MMMGDKPVISRSYAWSHWLFAAMTPGIVAASLGLFSGIAFASTGPYQRASQPTATYVAVGDSFASGDGIKAQGWVNRSGVADGSSVANDGCDRSSEGYPELVSKWLQGRSLLAPMTLSFLACSGATTTDVWSGSPSRRDGLIGASGDNGEGEQLGYAQLKNARVVTITIGGNDFNFSDVIANCLDFLLHSCNAQSNDGWIADLAHNIQTLKASLISTYQAIRTAAPGASVYVVGYPAIFPTNPSGGCQGLTKSAITYLASMQKPLNEVIQAAAAAASVNYVDPNSGPYSFIGHDVCQSKNSWVQGLSPFGSAASFHPNQQGQAAMASSVEAAISSSLAASASERRQ
jgi:lysophospholipase L1-like esterase